MSQRDDITTREPGFEEMTLRDYFAACAVQGELASQGPEKEYKHNTATQLAQWSYVVADAMLAARRQPKED